MNLSEEYTLAINLLTDSGERVERAIKLLDKALFKAKATQTKRSATIKRKASYKQGKTLFAYNVKEYKERVTYFSQLFVRLRDTDENGLGRCYTCSRVIQFGTNNCEAGHYLPRAHSKVKWNLDNMRAQCYHCNHPREGEPHIFRAKLIEEIGEGKVLLMESVKKSFYAPKQYELEKLLKERKEMCLELIGDKNFEVKLRY